MKKGELVTLRHKLQSPELVLAYGIAPQDTWKNPGVVVRGVYEGQIRMLDPITGKSYATEITPVVDIMIIGKLIQEVPIKILQKAEG
jgi:hypothetical protein